MTEHEINPKSITEVMRKHHDKIEGMLNTFENKKDIDSFSNLKWEVEKHMFTEEKAIFSIHLDTAEVSGLLEEHKDMMKLLTGEDTDTKTFRKLLTKHKDFEEAVIYPKLDKELDERKKELLIERIGHIK